MAKEVSYMTKEEASVAHRGKSRLVESTISGMLDRGECVSAAALVSAAESRDHPLHRFFEWDDTEAGRKYRLAQATQMIMATKYVAVLKQRANDLPQVVSVQAKVEVRKLLQGRDRDAGFRNREDVLASADDRAALIERKKSVLRGWCREVSDIEELSALRKLIEKEVG